MLRLYAGATEKIQQCNYPESPAFHVKNSFFNIFGTCFFFNIFGLTRILLKFYSDSLVFFFRICSGSLVIHSESYMEITSN